MSFTHIASAGFGNGSNSTSTAMPGVSPGATIPVGGFCVIGFAANTAALTVSTCTDDAGGGVGNTWNKATTPLTGTTLSCGFVFSKITTALTPSNIVSVTMSATSTRRGIWIDGWNSTNNSGALDQSGSVASATVSPITTSTTAALAQTTDLLISILGWLGGAVGSGYAHSTPAGFTAGDVNGFSGGTTPNVECRYAYKDSAGATTGWAGVSTVTSITRAHAWALSFSDVAGAAVHTPPLHTLVVRRTRSGA